MSTSLQPSKHCSRRRAGRPRVGGAWTVVTAVALVILAGTGEESPRAWSDEPRAVSPERKGSGTESTRLIPLYHTRDVNRVLALMRAPAVAAPGALSAAKDDRLQALADERRKLLAQQESLFESRRGAPHVVAPAGFILPTPADSIAERLASLKSELASLDARESELRLEAFRQESLTAAAESPLTIEPLDSPTAVDRVRITVVGEGQIHLRGPLEGINAIAGMIHEIDQPVGQVKIGIHVVQFTGSEDAGFHGVHGVIDRHLGHARRMSQTSQTLFRTALSNVAARYQAAYPDGFEEAFFYAPCVRVFRKLNGSNGSLSVAMLDSRDIVTTLYLAGLTNRRVRQEILSEFQRLVALELPKVREPYARGTQRGTGREEAESSFFGRLGKVGFRSSSSPNSAADAETITAEAAAEQWSFPQTSTCLVATGEQFDSANAIQISTVRVQQALFDLRRAQAEVAAMRHDRRMLAFMSSNRLQPVLVTSQSTETLDSDAFGMLADQVIEEQAARLVDLREVLRAELAALDGQLRRLAAAFEDDLRGQFYKPAVENLRRDSGAWKVQMGQVQTTTIRTNDRTLARVSPGQTAVLDRPVRPVLLQEGLQVADGLAQEGSALAQSASLRAVGDAFVPGSGALLSRTGVAPAPGQRLGELVGRSERVTVRAGDEISLTPVIQPDGCSVAFHLMYAHAPQRTSEGASAAPGGVQRHLIETDVQMPSMEWQEVSRFRVSLNAAEQGKGIPILEDVPVAGALFRPRRTASATMQENVILVECMVYPTASTFVGKGSLALEAADSSAGAAGSSNAFPPPGVAKPKTSSDETTDWVLKTLRRRAQASVADAEAAGDTRVGESLRLPTAVRPLATTPQ